MTTADQAGATRDTDLAKLTTENADLSNFTQNYETSTPFQFDTNDPNIAYARQTLQNTQGAAAQDIGRSLAQRGVGQSGDVQKAILGQANQNAQTMLGVSTNAYNTQMGRYINQMHDVYSQKLNSMQFENTLSQQQYSDAVDRYFQQLSIDTANATLKYQQEQQQQNSGLNLFGDILGAIPGIGSFAKNIFSMATAPKEP
jgi:flavorubredoxin